MNNFYDNILIIDDNRVSNFFNKTTIKECGITKKVTALDDSREAFNFINPKKSLNRFPDMVFLDLYMPNMNGWEFLDKFSAHEKANESIFVVMCDQDLLPEEKIKLNQYSFVKAVTDKNLTKDFIYDLVNNFFISKERKELKYS